MKRHQLTESKFNTRRTSHCTMPIAFVAGSGSDDGPSGDDSLGEYSIDPVVIWGSGGTDNQGNLGEQMSYLDSILGGNDGQDMPIEPSFDGSGSSDSNVNESIQCFEYGNMICEMTPTQFEKVKSWIDKLPAFLKILKLKIKIGQTKGGVLAHYNSSTNTVVLNQDLFDSWTYDHFGDIMEEFFHSWQDMLFSREGTDMGQQSKSAVEYEAKVMKWLYEAAMMKNVDIPEDLNDIVDWIYKCLKGLSDFMNGYDWSYFDYHVFYEYYRQNYDRFVEFYKSNGNDDIGDYSKGDYEFWEDHWNYFFAEMGNIFDGNSGIGTDIIITPGSGVGSASYPDVGSY